MLAHFEGIGYLDRSGVPSPVSIVLTVLSLRNSAHLSKVTWFPSPIDCISTSEGIGNHGWIGSSE
uniref:Uncharacterized protein n=1 Tax=Magallana gigas TaxID=29159 RepID=K1Q2Y7_MAGGI